MGLAHSTTFMSKTKPADSSGKGKAEKPEKTPAEKARGTRETVESIIVAVILAFLFRAFEAEAFVIPTGSMAPTLQGRHHDVVCEKCQHRYRTGVSEESMVLVGTTCPICRYTMSLDYFDKPNERPFNGDRILVNKFAYELAEPKRWDVMVFKYPGNAKQNYIKRLVGLPGERLRVQYGNVYVRKREDRGYHIARKPADKVAAMLQLVDDTNHLPEDLVKAGWPSRWQAWSADGAPTENAFKRSENGKEFTSDGASSNDAWLRYHHIIPSFDDWSALQNNQIPADLKERQGQLITDFYAYNCERDYSERHNMIPYTTVIEAGPGAFKGKVEGPKGHFLGWNWVGDLAVECTAKVESDSGELLLDLIEGGSHYQCRINLADGVATLSIDGDFKDFKNEQASATKSPSAVTPVKGKGTYRVRLANVDDQLFLWVNDWPVAFDGPTTYGEPVFDEPANVKPVWTAKDPSDLAPAGVGAKGAAVTLSNLQIHRDVYYIACDRDTRFDDDKYKDTSISGPEVERVFADPATWNRTTLFESRRFVEFPHLNIPDSYFGPDQFFPMGDNSPASQDGRLWAYYNGDEWYPPPYVERNLLIGKALYVYWPHTWNRPVPFTPNFERMRLIK